MNTLSWQLPVLLLGFFFAAATAGFYAFALKILQGPLGIISGAISQAFIPEATQARRTGRSRELVIEVFNKLAFFAFVPIISLVLFGKDLFAFVFGDSWVYAGEYAQLLGAWFFIWFVSSPLSATVLVYERLDFEFALSITALALRTFAILLGGFLGDAWVAIFMISLAGIISHGFLLYIVFKLSGLKFQDFRVSILQLLTRSLPTCLALIVLKFLINDAGAIFLLVTAILLVHFFVNKNFFLAQSKLS